jgi:hemerythrin-like domain-containing protein
MSATAHRPAPEAQLDLPGQTHVAAGPHSLDGMYVMHFAFRRTLDDMVAGVRRTPSADAVAWRAMSAYWDGFAAALHHHHDIEDVAIWPTLLAHAEARGLLRDRETLEAMEAEHAVIDPSLAACHAGFADMVSHPCEDHRHSLDVRVTALREALAQHLLHEETEALPMLQATMTTEEWAASEAYAQQSFETRSLPFLVGWVLHDLPPVARRRMFRMTGPVYRVLALVLCPRFERLHRRAFGPHVSGAPAGPSRPG